MHRDNREATQSLINSIPRLIGEACHCTEIIQITPFNWKFNDKENGEKLGSIKLTPNYSLCSVRIESGDLFCSVQYIAENIVNVRVIALFLNDMRLRAGVQCEDWAEKKVELGI